jgi:arylsulfatase A-like enzyme
MNEDEVVFPKLLEEHGYRTACIGKTHCGRGSQMIWDWNMNPADAFGTTVPAATPFHPEHFPEAVYMHHEVSSNPNRMLYGKYPAPVEVTKSYRITTEGMKWVYHNDDPRPFLLRLSFDDPHPPVVPPEPYFSMYDPASLPDDLFAQARESLANKPRMVREYNKLMGCEPLTEADHRKHAAVYLGFVSHVDAQMGRFLDYYLRSEFAENTIFIANSDHGHYIGEHGFAGKGVGMHEGVSRIPTIISWPGKLRENAETQALTDGTDLMPTILDLLDLPIPDNIVGRSLAPVLRGESERHKEEVFLQWSDFGCGLVRDRYKLTWYRGDDEGELYDLKNDPLEKNNLFAEPALSEIRENMLQRLQEFREIR